MYNHYTITIAITITITITIAVTITITPHHITSTTVITFTHRAQRAVTVLQSGSVVATKPKEAYLAELDP